MAYNLPPPWDPGFALPSNVRDEGLQRRGFVTRQLPRGTYDDPKVGTAGYAVPAYVVSEGYGQGVKVTRWAQRGRYDIPVPNYLNTRPEVVAERRSGRAQVVTMKALSGTELPSSYVRFGERAATAVLRAVQMAPPAQRKGVLKTILDRVDPSLYSRAMALGQQLAKTMPANAAMHAALARSMSEGAARELVEVGRTGLKPSARSVLGLGCYGVRSSMALSGVAALGADTPFRAAAELGLVKTPASTVGPQPGNCTPDGYFWTGTYWRRKGSNDVCTGTYNRISTGTAGPSGGVSVTIAGTNLTAEQAAAQGLTFLRVGGWTMQDKEGVEATYNKATTTAAHKSEIVKGLLTATLQGIAKSRISGAYTESNSQLVKFSTLGLGGSDGLVWKKAVEDGVPVAKFKHPVSGKTCMVYARITPTSIVVWWKVYVSQWEWLIGHLASWIATILSPVMAAVKEVANLACQLAQSPNATQAGAAIGVAAGAGASVGAAGAAIVQSACYEPPPPQEQTTQTGSGLPIMPLAIAGAGIAAALLLTRKK